MFVNTKIRKKLVALGKALELTMPSMSKWLIKEFNLKKMGRPKKK